MVRLCCASALLACAGAWSVPGVRPRPLTRLGSSAPTKTYQVIDIPSDKPKAEEEAPPEPTPEEEEAALVAPIEGRPKVGVSGFWKDAARSDQRVLDVLHAQNAWGGKVLTSTALAATVESTERIRTGIRCVACRAAH